MSAADPTLENDWTEEADLDWTGEFDGVGPSRLLPDWIGIVLVAPLAVIVAVYLQVALSIDSRVLGAVPDFSLIVLVALALRLGPAWGAAAGFATGLLLDVAVQTPLGSSSLVLTPIGWAVGSFAARRQRDPLLLAFAVLIVMSFVRALADAGVAVAIDAQGVAWISTIVVGIVGAMLTLLVGIGLLPALRSLFGSIQGSGV